MIQKKRKKQENSKNRKSSQDAKKVLGLRREVR